MILTDTEILSQIKQGAIIISPFQRSSLGSNSYDVHLSAELAVYDHDVLDAKMCHRVRRSTIPEDGLIMVPQELYLGMTVEYTETHMHVPFLEGKSSVGRLGIDIHATAGKGDIGFCNRWTLEISVKKPVRIYAGMPIGQLIYFQASGNVMVPYKDKPSAKYNTPSSAPVESMMYKNFVTASLQKPSSAKHTASTLCGGEAVV